MTHTIDANLLLYASDSSSPFHDRAIELIDDMATSPEIVYLFWPTVMAYLRIATHPAVFDELSSRCVETSPGLGIARGPWRVESRGGASGKPPTRVIRSGA